MTATEPPAPEDSWPTPEGETGVIARSDTLVGGTPPPVAPGPPPPVGPPPDRRIGAGMLLGIGAIALVAAGIAIAWFLTHRGSGNHTTTVVVTTAPRRKTTVAKVAVPRVVGMKETAAVARIASVGLKPKEIYRPSSKPKGLVLSQSPQEATELAKGRQVTIVVDAGAPKVAVPDLTGQPASAASAALAKLGLNATVTKATSTKPAGTVIDQAPKPNAKLAKGSVVTLSVAQAPATTTTTAAPSTTTQQTTTQAQSTTTTAAPQQPATATMPNVTGQSEQAAVQAMGQAGILPSIVFVPAQDELGTIEQQAKQAGATVPFHGHVQINASTGPGQKPQEQVPNVVGKTLSEAVAAMQSAHLRLIYLKYPVDSQAKAGKIVQQSPIGGSAPQNAQILVFLAAYKG
jgi:beta-lactam-binding protein with PASTA domain